MSTCKRGLTRSTVSKASACVATTFSIS
jgi:hypothetical protein